MKRHATLSICMIVRNEEAVLERCLSSLSTVRDQLCIVDTGSCDSTVSIAERFGAEVSVYHGCNDADGNIKDFADARNHALAMATGEWVLTIDADEVLEKGAGAIRSHLRRERYDSIGVQIHEGDLKWVVNRLFKRSSAGEYKGRIHEFIQCRGSFFCDRRIVISHLPNKRGKEGSVQRTLRLGLQAELDNPTDARTLYYIGTAYRNVGNLQMAIEYLRRSMALPSVPFWKFQTAYALGVCYIQAQQWDAALETGRLALGIDPRYAEAHCLLADAYRCSGNDAFAAQWYRSALSCRPPEDAMLGIQQWAYREHPRAQLAHISQSKRIASTMQAHQRRGDAPREQT